MKLLSLALKNCSHLDVFVGLILVAYIVSGVKLPAGLGASLNTNMGKIILILSIIFSYYIFCPAVAVLYGLAVVVYMHSNQKETKVRFNEVIGSEEGKMKLMKKSGNKFDKTLEEEVVSKMVPVVQGAPSGEASYKPTLSDGPDHASII